MVKIGTVDPLSLLERKDKWFLGGGKGSIYAPPFPRWLEKPGFWDESYFADIRLTRLFTVLFCDYGMHFVRLRGEVVSWRPDRMILEHRGDSHLVRETRLVTEAHEWLSVFELVSGEPLQAFVWALPELRAPGYGTPWQSLASCDVGEDSISYRFATAWPSELEPDRTAVEAENLSGEAEMLPPLTLLISVGANKPRLSHTVNLAQRHDDAPLWETSLLPQKLKNGLLPGDFKLEVGPSPVEGLVHILQQYELRTDEPLVVSCQASIAGHNPLIPGPQVIQQNEEAWRAFFASVPQFTSSDPYLTNAYWYRWYGLRLNTVDVPNLPISKRHSTKNKPQDFSPYVTEGIGFFRNFVTYSAQAHLREVAWMHSPALAVGILENLEKCQRDDGSFPGHNYSCRPARDFYHADFATGLFILKGLHGTPPKPQALRKYFDYLIRTRGCQFGILEGTDVLPLMILVFDQNETGQEYMSRYQFVSADADKWGTFKVCGVDATEYAMSLAHWLRSDSKDGEEQRVLRLIWDRLLVGITEMSFDKEAAFFCDVLPDGTRSPARPATGLYPMLGHTYLMWQNHGCELWRTYDRWMEDPNEFWPPKGFPATAFSDPTFSADGEWKQKRLNCPWNGRSWPMVNSHLVDAFANWARSSPYSGMNQESSPASGRRSEGDLRRKAGEALMKAVTLMFHNGDPVRPNSYEHYDPITGTPSLYRGYDDYMHSWIVDLILRHAVGVIPGQDMVDPLPTGVEWIECTDIPHPRGRMDVRIEGAKVVHCEVREMKA